MSDLFGAVYICPA